MSIAAMNWAWERITFEDLKPSAGLVLLALADHADGDGICWPGLKGISEKCNLERRNVRRIVRSLKEIQLLRVQESTREDGSKGNNRYELLMGGQGARPPREGGLYAPSTGRTGPMGGGPRAPGEGADPPRRKPPIESPIESREGFFPLSSSIPSDERPDADEEKNFVALVLETYGSLPGVRLKSSDRKTAAAFFREGKPLAKVEGALWVGAARRLDSKTPIASLKYFAPIIDEAIPSGYVEYCKQKVQTHGGLP